MKHSAIWKFWFGAALMLFAVLAQAAVSQIHTLSGTVSITYAGQAARAAQKGDRLESGTQVATGDKSFAMLRFEDGQIVALKSNSEFKVDAYRFNPKVDKDNQIGFTVSKGGLRAITGLIGKKNPDGFKLDTPTATIGIRGTTFDIHLDGGTFIRVTDGKIFIANPTGSLDLVAGQIAAILSRQTPPAPTTEGELPPGAKAGFQELENIVIDNLPPTGAGGGSSGLDADVIQALNETLDAITGGGEGGKELVVTTDPLPPPPPEDDKVKIVDEATVENERRQVSNKVDVFFLADNTGSMGGILSTLKDGAKSAIDELSGGSVSYGWGVGRFKGDPQQNEEPLLTAYELLRPVTENDGLPKASINQWTASGGHGEHAGSFYAIQQVATSGADITRAGKSGSYASGQATEWREGASKVILVFGDVPSWQSTVNEQELGDALMGAGVRASFIDIGSLNDDLIEYHSVWDDEATLFNGQARGAAQELADRTGGMYIRLSELTATEIETAILAAVIDANTDTTWTGGHMALTDTGIWRNRTASAIEVAFSSNNADFTLRYPLLADELISLDTSSANLVAGRPYYQKTGSGTWAGADSLWGQDLSNSQFVQWMPDKDFFRFQLKGGSDSQVLTGYYGRTLDAAKLPSSGITVFDLFSNANVYGEGQLQSGAAEVASGELVVNWANRKVFGFDNKAPMENADDTSRGFFIGKVNAETRKLEGRYLGFELCEGCTINAGQLDDIEDAERGNTNMQLYGLNQPVGFGGTFGAYWDNGESTYTDMMLTGLLNTTTQSYTASPADGEEWNGFAAAFVTTADVEGATRALSTDPDEVAITLTPSTGAVAAAVTTYEHNGEGWDGTAHALSTSDMSDLTEAYVTPKAFGVMGTIDNDDAGLVTATAQTDTLAWPSEPTEVEGPLPTNHEFHYTSWGHWGRTEAFESGQQDIEPASLWVAGRLTPTESIPTNATGTYKGEVRGHVIDSSNVMRSVTGTTSLTAHFGSGSGSLEGSFNNLATSQGAWGAGTASVSASWTGTNAIRGTLYGSDITSGTIHGAFFGPNATELGGNWAIQKTDGSQGAGIHRSIQQSLTPNGLTDGD